MWSRRERGQLLAQCPWIVERDDSREYGYSADV